MMAQYKTAERIFYGLNGQHGRWQSNADPMKKDPPEKNMGPFPFRSVFFLRILWLPWEFGFGILFISKGNRRIRFWHLKSN
jgi:hypothetical protein